MSKLKQKYSELQQHHSSSSSEEEEEDDEDIICCICDSEVDDGFTIQCEKCDMWQHAKCYHIKKKNIPEHFICDRCIITEKKSRRRTSIDSHLEDRKKKTFKKEDSPKQKKFISINKSIAKEKVVQDLFIEVHRQWIELNRPKNGIASKISGNKGLDSIVVMESNLLLPSIPKASLKPIKKSLRGSSSFSQNKNDPNVKKGIFADIHIPENRYLMEVTGQVIRKSEYKTESSNQFLSLGTPLPFVFFYPMLDVCIDSRYTGNDTRFVRRSCCPNSELKSIILPNDNEDQTIHLGIYTKESIDKGEEITIGWGWQRGHVMWKKNKEFLSKSTAEIMTEDQKKSLKETINVINNEIGKCACEDEEDCLFEYLKDELERRDIVKKKKTRTANVKPAVKNIFTSDEEEHSNKPKKSLSKTPKQVKFIEKSNLIAPSSPAVSVEESLDIDITSMSPAPEEVSFGIKRTRTSTGIQLPCKKKWLNDYIRQQQQKIIGVPVNKVSSSPKNVTKIENVYDEGDLSDGGSSQSTIPLEGTPSTTDLPTRADMAKDMEEIQDDEKLKSEEEASVDPLPLPELSEKNSASVVEPQELNDSAEGTPPPTEAAPKVKKLSIQEYLKRQRGNLPTPDEKN